MSTSVRLFGKTGLYKQRFQCLRCKRTFIWKERYNRIYRRQRWFKLWITESYSIRRLVQLSGYSAFTLNAIKNYWLSKMPDEQVEYSSVQYMLYDATYFHKDGCLLNLMNAIDQKIIAHTYVRKESFQDAYPWFNDLKQRGLNPEFITTDGERSVMRAIRLVWPGAILQRCLYHIQREGMRWLRTYPKTEAGKRLRALLSQINRIKNIRQRDAFIQQYADWLKTNQDYVRLIPHTSIAHKDLKRTMVLINNALPDMFHFLEDTNIYSTTNALEGFHSRLKADYRRHRGLSREHRIQYIHWYCYFENIG
jgi:Transposase, Mutator family